jgi:ABC-type transport system involved in multi-copper enzyme maturation permease subunit
MNWLMWRQHRRVLLALFVALVGYAALVVPTGLRFWQKYQDGLSACGHTTTCADLGSQLAQSASFSNVNPSQPSGGFNIVVLIVLALPFLLGMFVGVPLIAREYEARTNLLIWTRSISRRTWLTAKLLWALVATAAFAGIFASLTTWWSRTGNAVYANRFDSVKFGLQGIAPVGYAIFAVSLSIALGTWLKRIMVAIGIMFVVMLALQIVIGAYVRPHYRPPKTYGVSLPGNGYQLSAPVPPNSGSPFVIDSHIVSATGRPMSWSNPPQSCVGAQPGGPTSVGSHNSADATNGVVNMNGRAVDLKCLDKLGYHWITKYQPANSYWDFQIIETCLYLALSLVPLGATYWLVLRRDA